MIQRVAKMKNNNQSNLTPEILPRLPTNLFLNKKKAKAKSKRIPPITIIAIANPLNLLLRVSASLEMAFKS